MMGFSERICEVTDKELQDQTKQLEKHKYTDTNFEVYGIASR